MNPPSGATAQNRAGLGIMGVLRGRQHRQPVPFQPFGERTKSRIGGVDTGFLHQRWRGGGGRLGDRQHASHRPGERHCRRSSGQRLCRQQSGGRCGCGAGKCRARAECRGRRRRGRSHGKTAARSGRDCSRFRAKNHRRRFRRHHGFQLAEYLGHSLFVSRQAAGIDAGTRLGVDTGPLLVGLLCLSGVAVSFCRRPMRAHA